MLLYFSSFDDPGQVRVVCVSSMACGHSHCRSLVCSPRVVITSTSRICTRFRVPSPSTCAPFSRGMKCSTQTRRPGPVKCLLRRGTKKELPQRLLLHQEIEAKSCAAAGTDSGPPAGSIPRKVGVFWDLDNKPPKNIPPYNAAVHLKNLASGFGEVADVVAYANRHAFSFIPEWVREQRRERKRLDQMEMSGELKVTEPYVCSMCGRKCSNNVLLKKHFKQLHERERKKRMSHLDHLKGKRRLQYKKKNADREVRYKQAATGIILPKVGYGLASELRRAGVFVRTVQDQPQAADVALKRHMLRSLKDGVKCICLVSDDSGFGDILRMARFQKLRTVVVGDTPTLKKSADVWFSWDDVASGRARLEANNDYDRWANEDALARELVDDESTPIEAGMNLAYDDQDHFMPNVWRVNRVSVFSDEDDLYDNMADDGAWYEASSSDEGPDFLSDDEFWDGE